MSPFQSVGMRDEMSAVCEIGIMWFMGWFVSFMAFLGTALLGTALLAQEMWVTFPSDEWIETLSSGCVENVWTAHGRSCCRNYTRIWVEAGPSGGEMGGALLALRTELARSSGTPGKQADLCASFETLLNSSMSSKQRAQEAIRLLRGYRDFKNGLPQQGPLGIQEPGTAMQEIASIYSKFNIDGLKEYCVELLKKSGGEGGEGRDPSWRETQMAQTVASQWLRWLDQSPPSGDALVRHNYSTDIFIYADFLSALNDISGASADYEGQRISNVRNLLQSEALIDAVRRKLQDLAVETESRTESRKDASNFPPLLGDKNICSINDEDNFSKVNKHLQVLARSLPSMTIAEVGDCSDLYRFAALSILPLLRAAAIAESKRFFENVKSLRTYIADTKSRCDVGWAISDLLAKDPDAQWRDPKVTDQLRNLLGGNAK
jgi:hypothetical protein